MAATVEAYLTIVRNAYEGKLKLPAFQRSWTWKSSAVILLLDSLRQGFPIGSFLFLQSSSTVDLAPREFQSSSPTAATAAPEYLVLDGQQRITAGLELFFGLGSNHYFIDLQKLKRLAQERAVNLDDRDSRRAFLADLDATDGYCVRTKASPNSRSKLISAHLCWTGLFLDDDEFESAITDYCKAYPNEEPVAKYLLGRNFRPSADANIPITTIGSETRIEAISRIFSTLNSTGKILTPFELVVAILFPQNVHLNTDLDTYREMFPHYSKIDTSGDILLQTIALFDGKDTKKSSLPRTITAATYRRYCDESAELLDESARFVSERIGLGLESSSELSVYPVIFTPIAWVWGQIKTLGLNVQEKASAEQKLVRWFVGAVLSRRYQQSTHEKQARDKVDMFRWITEGDNAMPEWVSQTFVTNLRTADPDGATGKLFRALLNSRGLRDPLSSNSVGVGIDKRPSSKHHIWPTRFVQTLGGWDRSVDNANLALNIMYVEEPTNGHWLNTDPRLQLEESIRTVGSERAVRELYRQHGITEAAFDIMLKPTKSRDDFGDFITERESFFAGLLDQYGFKRAVISTASEILEDEEV